MKPHQFLCSVLVFIALPAISYAQVTSRSASNESRTSFQEERFSSRSFQSQALKGDRIQSLQGGSDAGGGDGTVLEFKALGYELIARLRSHGYVRIDELSIDAFERTLRAATIVPLETDLFLNGESRDAINYPSQVRIELHEPSWQKRAIETRRQMVVHEVMGLLSIDDKDYQRSTSVILRSRLRPDAANIEVRRAMEQSEFQTQSKSSPQLETEALWAVLGKSKNGLYVYLEPLYSAACVIRTRFIPALRKNSGSRLDVYPGTCFDFAPDQIEILKDIIYKNGETIWETFADIRHSLDEGYQLGDIIHSIDQAKSSKWGDKVRFQFVFCKKGFEKKCQGQPTRKYSAYRTEDLVFGGFFYEVSWD